MADRSWSTPALVLSLTSFGEGNRDALLLTADRGLVRATVYGGAKSALRARVSPYQTGTAWLYSDPVRKTTKITDFDVTSWRSGIRENLVRTWCAACCAEIVTRSQGIADWRLVNAFYDGINASDEDECRRGLLRFLWRALTAAGIAPDIRSCARCGAQTGSGVPGTVPAGDAGAEPGPAGGRNPANEVLYYLPHEDCCACAACARSGERAFPLSPGSRAFLSAVTDVSPHDARRIRPAVETFAELRHFLFFLASRMVDGPLKTLETGDGIL